METSREMEERRVISYATQPYSTRVGLRAVRAIGYIVAAGEGVLSLLFMVMSTSRYGPAQLAERIRERSSHPSAADGSSLLIPDILFVFIGLLGVVLAVRLFFATRELLQAPSQARNGYRKWAYGQILVAVLLGSTMALDTWNWGRVISRDAESTIYSPSGAAIGSGVAAMNYYAMEAVREGLIWFGVSVIVPLSVCFVLAYPRVRKLFDA